MKIMKRMKKLLIVACCALLICLIPVSAFAAEADSADSAESAAFAALVSKQFEQWVIPHLEEISVIVTLIVSCACQIHKNKLLSKSVGTMNNNTVAIAEQSASMMDRALVGMESASLAVKGYDERIEALLTAHGAALEDREKLETELNELKQYLRTSAAANVEFANELAELLGLANIPNYKKEEIGARHLAAVRSLAAADPNPENEVNCHDGQEA